jgi:hypothetical protein
VRLLLIKEGVDTYLFSEHLAMYPFFMQLFHPACDNWLPFYWKGFSQTTHYTYVIDELLPLDRVWEGLDKRLRAQIRKAKKNGLQVKPCSADVVFDMSMKTFQRQGMHHPLTRSVQAILQGDAARTIVVHEVVGVDVVHPGASGRATLFLNSPSTILVDDVVLHGDVIDSEVRITGPKLRLPGRGKVQAF